MEQEPIDPPWKDAPADGRKERVVLDTSLFVNPDVRTSLGSGPTEAIETFVSLARNIDTIEFYMPPSTFRELMNFVDRERLPAELMHHLRQKPPRRHEIMIPGYVLYELVDELRDRVNKGLRIAETGIRATEKRKLDEIIQDTRKKYREALREGIVDSGEDVDLLLLARELDALLITADQGLIDWAEKFGIRWLFPEKFRAYLETAAGSSKE